MNVSNFAVSVQWGKGPHYFVATDLETKHVAELLVGKMKVSTMQLFVKKKGRAPQPHVYLWQRVPGGP